MNTTAKICSTHNARIGSKHNSKIGSKHNAKISSKHKKTRINNKKTSRKSRYKGPKGHRLRKYIAGLNHADTINNYGLPSRSVLNSSNNSGLSFIRVLSHEDSLHNSWLLNERKKISTFAHSTNVVLKHIDSSNNSGLPFSTRVLSHEDSLHNSWPLNERKKISTFAHPNNFLQHMDSSNNSGVPFSTRVLSHEDSFLNSWLLNEWKKTSTFNRSTNVLKPIDSGNNSGLPFTRVLSHTDSLHNSGMLNEWNKNPIFAQTNSINDSGLLFYSHTDRLHNSGMLNEWNKNSIFAQTNSINDSGLLYNSIEHDIRQQFFYPNPNWKNNFHQHPETDTYPLLQYDIIEANGTRTQNYEHGSLNRVNNSGSYGHIDCNRCYQPVIDSHDSEEDLNMFSPVYDVSPTYAHGNWKWLDHDWIDENYDNYFEDYYKPETEGRFTEKEKINPIIYDLTYLDDQTIVEDVMNIDQTETEDVITQHTLDELYSQSYGHVDCNRSDSEEDLNSCPPIYDGSPTYAHGDWKYLNHDHIKKINYSGTNSQIYDGKWIDENYDKYSEEEDYCKQEIDGKITQHEKRIPTIHELTNLDDHTIIEDIMDNHQTEIDSITQHYENTSDEHEHTNYILLTRVLGMLLTFIETTRLVAEGDEREIEIIASQIIEIIGNEYGIQNNGDEDEDENQDINGGLSEETISAQLQTRILSKSITKGGDREEDDLMDDDVEEEGTICVICQLQYEDEEVVGSLRCQHEYHADCISKWLLLKNICPLCKYKVSSREIDFI